MISAEANWFLTALTEANVERLVWGRGAGGPRAVGVQYRRRGQVSKVYAR